MELIQEYLGYGNSYIYDYVSDGMRLSDWQRILATARIAETSTHRFPIGAAVYRRRKPVASAVNVRKTSPRMFPNRESVHAEMCALNKLVDPAGSTVYVARLDKQGCLASAQPCLYCVIEMQKLNIDRVVFTKSSTSADSFHLNMVSSPLVKE